MKRAAVIIGVDRTKDLPPLNDAAKGAQRMAEWARSEGFCTTLITDHDGPVEARDIRRTVTGIVHDACGYEQLLIYFAGHGVNIRYGEYWLLSDAPDDPQAAVNVQGSATLARYSGINHVVFISDACRTAAEGMKAQYVSGSEIFPNDVRGGEEKPVDLFYACTLGRPAYEVRDPAISASQFSALYTEALIEALRGALPDAVDWVSQPDETPVAYVRPRLLKKAVSVRVVARILEHRLQASLIQVPDAHICSDDKVWLARLSKLPEDAMRGVRSGRRLPKTEAERASELIKSALATAAPAGGFKEPAPGGLDSFQQPAGSCCFRVQGTGFASAHTHQARQNIVRNPALACVVDVVRQGESVLLQTDNGRCVVLPAFQDAVVTLTFEGDELVDVTYEPSTTNLRWNEYQSSAGSIRALRTLVASVSLRGLFHLDTDDAGVLTQRMQYAERIDPSLALYAAYAINSPKRHDLIGEICKLMVDDLGGCLFDLAMLTRAPVQAGSAVPRAERPVLSPFPMLSQGWAWLSPLDMQLPASLFELQRLLTSSLWTAFEADAELPLRNALIKGELR